MTNDAARVHLDGGSVSIDLGLSAGITRYIEDGVHSLAGPAGTNA
jgi:hypothetical protein